MSKKSIDVALDVLIGVINEERRLREEAELKAVKATDALTDIAIILDQIDQPTGRRLQAIRLAVMNYYASLHVESEEQHGDV